MAKVPWLARMGQNFYQVKRDNTFWPMPNILKGSVQLFINKVIFFQVVTGGHYDVDVLLMDPKKNVIYKQVKKQYDSYTWTAAMYELITCFHEFRIYEFFSQSLN